MNLNEMNAKWNAEKTAIKNTIITSDQASTLIAEMYEITGESMSLNEAISHKAKINILN